MQYNPDEFNEILNIYKAESEEIIQELNDSFMELEKNPADKTPIKKLFQLAHSLKGASRMLEFNSVQDISHKLEDILSYWKKEDVIIKYDFFQVIYEVCDYLNELVNKSVILKANYWDDNVNLFINKLDNFIISNHMIPVEEYSNKFLRQTKDVSENLKAAECDTRLNNNLPQKNYIVEKSVDVKAFILELIFVLDKDNTSNNLEEVLLVISEDLKQIAEIFSKTDFKEIKEQIAVILSIINIEGNKDSDIELIKQKILDLRSEIYKLYKNLNISANVVKQQPVKNQLKQESYVKEEEIKQENKTEKKFDFILSNLQKIKYEKSFLKEVLEILKSIINDSNNSQISCILNKTVNIINLFIKKDVIINNDCYIVILQCIYLAKKMSLNDKEENLNNVDFLIQRLNIVEDMLNITDIHPIEKQKKNEKNVISPENYSDLRNNINQFDLQEIKTLRVDTSKVDCLISQINELLINGIKTKEHIIELSKINSQLLKLNNISKEVVNYLNYIEKKGYFNSDVNDKAAAFYKKTQGFFTNNAETINEISGNFEDLYNVILEDDNKLNQTALEIESIAKNIRVLPLATLFHSFPRMIRDIARENNKKIDFIIKGSDTTVDKKIIEEIKMPLIHILRNSVSHGIETPQDRLKNNKPETGVIKLEAKQLENYIIITIEDDGYGIDIEKVRQIALNKKLLLNDEINAMNSEQLMKLLFLPGFSTEESVTEISGRGIGLDIVKTKITNLNGDIFIDSVLNKGCKVAIRLPLSMSAIKVFILLVNNQKYALPINSVRCVKQIKKEEILKRNGINSIIYNDHSIPVYFLSDVFCETNNLLDAECYTAIIIENQEYQAAYIADGLLSDIEVFQKKLIPPILKIKNISGFTTLSTGEVCLIINPYELIRNTISDMCIESLELKKLTLE